MPIFRWVECQLRSLCKYPCIVSHLKKWLSALPQSLDATYERMLCSIELQEEAQKILSLLCYASRPLSIDEVAEAFAVDIDDRESYNPESRFRGGPDEVLRICPV